MGKFKRFILDLIADGYKLVGVVAPALSATFTVTKMLDVEIIDLKSVSYAWAILPLVVWLLIAYIRRRSAHLDDLQNLIEPAPNPKFFLINRFGKWYVEIENFVSNADFCGVIDFAQTSYAGYSQHPKSVQWSDSRSKLDLSRTILDGSRDSFFVYGIKSSPIGKGVSCQTSFAWVENGKSVLGRGNNRWVKGLDEGNVDVHLDDIGILEFVVSSDPPMKGGNRTFKLKFEDEDVSIVEGDIEKIGQ